MDPAARQLFRREYGDEPEFSEDQLAALAWLKNWRAAVAGRSAAWVTLGGYAGTGKSTIVAHLCDEWEAVAVAAPTGKAAHVLRSKGVGVAQTLHSLIYIPYRDERGKIRYRKAERIQTPDGTPARTVIVDEASMVSVPLHNDLLSYGIPVLYVGDHGQLEPFGQDPGIMASPDVRLEKIHRQALGNPIIRLAAAFREGRAHEVPLVWPERGKQTAFDRLRLTTRARFNDVLHSGWQLVCGYRKTRHAVNAKVREKRGYTSDLPEPGETLICLNNSRDYGVFNGMQATVTEVKDVRGTVAEMVLRSDDDRTIMVPVCTYQFGQDKIEDWHDKWVTLWDYGYCLTAHKSQGSEWDRLAVLEEIGPSWDAARWRYTAVTRAKERLVYCR